MPYWLVSMIQKSVHAAMQAVPELRLSRETPDYDIEQMLDSVIGTRRLEVGEFLVSGD